MEKIARILEKHPKPFIRMDVDVIELITQQTADFNVTLPSHMEPEEFFLVIDIYSEINHVHPEGHIGWWKFEPEKERQLKVVIKRTVKGYSVTLNNDPSKEKWINTEWAEAESDILALHVVLRNARTEAIEVDERIPVYRNKDVLQRARQENETIQNDLEIASPLRTRWFFWPKGVTVRLVAADVRVNDAVGNFVFQIYKHLRFNKVPCRIYAQNFSANHRGVIRPVSDLFFDLSEKDILFLHFSTYDPYLEIISDLPCKKICYYHSITPPEMFQIYDAESAVRSSKAFGQYRLMKKFDVLMANSKVSIRELRLNLEIDVPQKSAEDSEDENFTLPEDYRVQKTMVCPPLLNARKWETFKEDELDIPENGTVLLFIGRIAPHKKIEDLISLFAEYHRIDRGAKLLVIGSTAFQGYRNYIDYLIGKQSKSVQRNIYFRSGVSDAYLKKALKACSMYVSMSEHEGFCIPLVEAMAFGKPVFAYNQVAVRETMQRSGRLFSEKDFQQLASEMYDIIHSDDVSQKIIEAQQHRFSEIDSSTNGEAIWDAIEWALNNDNGSL